MHILKDVLEKELLEARTRITLLELDVRQLKDLDPDLVVDRKQIKENSYREVFAKDALANSQNNLNAQVRKANHILEMLKELE